MAKDDKEKNHRGVAISKRLLVAKKKGIKYEVRYLPI
jgi:hypothetical protein